MADIVITGAGGFIGRALARSLALIGYEVKALTRDDGDVTHASFWQTLPSAKALVHLAGRSYVPDSWRMPAGFLDANVTATQHALDWCHRNSARMVFSSAYVYGIPARLPIQENDAVKPNNPYALSKYLAEQCCEFAANIHHIDCTVLRLFNVFGRGQREDFLVPTLARQLTGSEIRVMDLAPRRDYVYLADTVAAFISALSAPKGFHCLNIGSGQSHSVEEIVAALQDVAGTHLPVISMAKKRVQEIPDVRADISLAREVLGWQPVHTLISGLHDMRKDENRE